MDLSRITWRKSSYSSSNGGACIEVAATPHAIAVRDGKNPDGPLIAFSSVAWRAFTERVGPQCRSANLFGQSH